MYNVIPDFKNLAKSDFSFRGSLPESTVTRAPVKINIISIMYTPIIT